MSSRRKLRVFDWFVVGVLVVSLVLLPFPWSQGTAMAQATTGPCNLTPGGSQTSTIRCASGGTGTGGCQGSLVVTLDRSSCGGVNETPCTNSPANLTVTYPSKSTDRGTTVWLACLAKYQKSCYACITGLGLPAILPPSSSGAAAVVGPLCGTKCQLQNLNVCCYTTCSADYTNPSYQGGGTTCQ